MISCLRGYIWTAPRIPFLAMMRLNFVYGSIPKKRSEVFDAIITPNYAGWLVNALFGLEPTHGDDPKGKLRIIGNPQPRDISTELG